LPAFERARNVDAAGIAVAELSENLKRMTAIQGQEVKGSYATNYKSLVAGEGFEPSTFGL
jgi:hypothetical protein